MNLQQVTEAVSRGHQQWEQLKQDWYNLKLPGSPYVPGDFTAALLLALMGGTPEQTAERVRAAVQTLENLKRQPDMTFLTYGSDPAPVLALALLQRDEGQQAIGERPVQVAEAVTAAEIAAEPQPEAAQLTACPHCAHNFQQCAAGAYRQEAEVERGVIAKAAAEAAEAVVAEAEAVQERRPPCSHIGLDGKCTNCTDDEVFDCSDCEETITEAGAHPCKNPDCDDKNAYCDNCCEQNLNERGYCNDCAIFSCSRCDNEVGRDDEKRCASDKCRQNDDLCAECAARLLNNNGLCSDCSGEEAQGCSDCDRPCTQSRVVRCRNYDDCGNAYCVGCAQNDLTQGLCEDCQNN